MKRKIKFIILSLIICLSGMAAVTGCGVQAKKEEKQTLGEEYNLEAEELYSLYLYCETAGEIFFQNDGESESQTRKTLRYGKELLNIQLGKELPKGEDGAAKFEATLSYHYEEHSEEDWEFEQLKVEQYEDYMMVARLEDDELKDCRYYELNIDTMDAFSRLKEMLVANNDTHDFDEDGNLKSKDRGGNEDGSTTVIPGCGNSDGDLMSKPVLYFYPEREMDMEVLLQKIDLTCTYPAYQNGWHITAEPDGTIRTKGSSREYYCLYYEGIANLPTDTDTGFVVEKKDYQSFLEEKLEILGLTEREAQEFIIYWLPVMQEHDRLFIHFLEQEILDNQVPLKITPEPETVIRVLMQIREPEEGKQVKEQQLKRVRRKGCTVVEWGGSVLDITGSMVH